MSRTPSNVFLLVSLTLAACASDGDGGSGPSFDGSVRRDATVIDGGPATDAGTAFADTGAADAGPLADAGVQWCPSGECDPRTVGSCGDAGVCALSGLEPACAEPTASLEAGMACERSSDCAEGLACFRDGDEGVCGAPCCPGDESACTGEARCLGAGTLVDGTVTDWWRCVPPRPCDPLDPNACEPGEGCFIVSAEGDTDCRRAGFGDVGQRCEQQADCAAGLFCGGLASKTCSRICSLDEGDGPACPSAEGNCRAYSQSPPGTGICTIEATARYSKE